MTLLWKPLLSATVPIDSATGDFAWAVVPFPVYASPKLDGFRAMVQGGILVSRNGLPVRNRQLQARYSRPEYEGLDGELCDGNPTAPDVFNRTSRVVKKAEADAQRTKLYVIDHSADADPLKDRIRKLREVSTGWTDGMDRQTVVLIRQTFIRDIPQLRAYEAKMLTCGYEGVMLRCAKQGAYPQKPGKENRSTLREFYLARLKRFEHSDAEILAVHPLRHNLNQEKTAAGRRSSRKSGIVENARLIGSATLRDIKTGVVFDTNVNGDLLRAWEGWKDARRWKDTRVRYRYQVRGTKDKPRINTCGFEELLDQ